MAKPKVLSENGHEISILRKRYDYVVSVDGQEYDTFGLSNASKWILLSEDYPIEIDNEAYTLVLRGRKIRLAKDGYYVDNGKPHVETKPMPKWTWLFVILNVAILVVSMGGAIPAVIAFAGCALCLSISRSDESMTIKLVLCVGSTVLAWVVWFLFITFVASVYY